MSAFSPTAMVPAIATALLLLCAPASAIPKDTPLPGSTIGTVGGNFCAVKAGTSVFESTSEGVQQVLIDEIYYGNPGYLLTGLARFKFTGEKEGRLLFNTTAGYPKDIKKPRFSNYRARFKKSLNRLKLTFDIEFPGCTVQFIGKYWD